MISDQIELLALPSMADHSLWGEKEPNLLFLLARLDSVAHSIVVLFRWRANVGSSPTTDRKDFCIIELGYCAKQVVALDIIIWSQIRSGTGFYAPLRAWSKFFFQILNNELSKWVMDTKNMDCIKKNGSTNYDLFIYNNSISSGYRNHYHFSCKCIFGHNLLNYIMLIHHFMDNAIIIKLLQNVSDYELLSSEWNINVSRMVNSIPS